MFVQKNLSPSAPVWGPGQIVGLSVELLQLKKKRLNKTSVFREKHCDVLFAENLLFIH